MDVATPTEDCLSLVHDLLAPVIMKGRVKGALSHQEVGISLCLLYQVYHLEGTVPKRNLCFCA